MLRNSWLDIDIPLSFLHCIVCNFGIFCSETYFPIVQKLVQHFLDCRPPHTTHKFPLSSWEEFTPFKGHPSDVTCIAASTSILSKDVIYIAIISISISISILSGDVIYIATVINFNLSASPPLALHCRVKPEVLQHLPGFLLLKINHCCDESNHS